MFIAQNMIYHTNIIEYKILTELPEGFVNDDPPQPVNVYTHPDFETCVSECENLQSMIDFDNAQLAHDFDRSITYSHVENNDLTIG